MKDQIDELINADGGLIHGSKKPGLDPKTSSAKTTDQVVSATRQDTTLGYRRFYGEATLPYNTAADRYSKQPKKFYEYLKRRGAEETFEQYFEKVDQNKVNTTNEAYLVKMAEDVLAKKSDRDIVSNKLFEQLDDENPILGKCIKRLCIMMNGLDESDKKLILGYIQKNG